MDINRRTGRKPRKKQYVQPVRNTYLLTRIKKSCEAGVGVCLEGNMVENKYKIFNKIATTRLPLLSPPMDRSSYTDILHIGAIRES